jgi:hypothetical protein
MLGFVRGMCGQVDLDLHTVCGWLSQPIKCGSCPSAAVSCRLSTAYAMQSCCMQWVVLASQ